MVSKKGLEISKKGLGISKKGLEISKKGLEISKKGLEFSKKGLEGWGFNYKVLVKGFIVIYEHFINECFLF